MSRPALLAVAAGAVCLGGALGGVASVDRDLQAATSTPAQPVEQVRLVSDHGPRHGCPHDGGADGLRAGRSVL